MDLGGGLLGGLLGGGGGGGGLLGGLTGGAGGLLGGLAGGAGGGLGGILGQLLPAAGMGLDLLQDPGLQDVLTQLSGPVLAGGACAFGFPEFAPMLLQAGPAIAQGAFGLLDAVGGGTSGSSSAGSSGSTTKSSSGSSGSSSKTSSSPSYSSGDDPQIEQKDILELQHLQDKQKEMFSLVSNVLRSMHDTKMAVINNVRA